jgi:hypothetical protein
VGLWGRSVASDPATLAESAQAALGAEVVTERVHDWLLEGFNAVAESAGGDVDAGLLAVAGSPVAGRAVAVIVEQFVAAALAPPGTEVTLDVADALAPLVPLITAEFEARGIDISAEVVAATVDGASAIVLETDESLGVTGSGYRVRTVLTRVLVIGSAALVVFGGLAIGFSEDRRRMVRTLATRLAVSAVTFTLLLRIGAWAVDPDGGRSPLAAGGSVLLRSNHVELLAVAGGAVAVALAAGLSIRRRRLARAAPIPAAAPDDTAERQLVGV